jgi:hypothetical protein
MPRVTPSTPAREARRLVGNRSWRIETTLGPALQKLYLERGGALAVRGREALIRLAGVKTSARARARRATERRLLRLWREHGFDVPQDWTDALPEFRAPNVAILEFIEGAVPLWDVLALERLSAARREAVLRAFSAEWGRRHQEALRSGEAGLVQEHGTIRHVLVVGALNGRSAESRHGGARASAGNGCESGGENGGENRGGNGAGSASLATRQVWIDLEQAFRPRRDLGPLISKEITSYLRSLWTRVGEERFRRDLHVIVDAYPDAGILRRAVDEYLRARGLRRALWATDRALRSKRRQRAKYGVLEILDEVLRERGT